MPRKMSGLTSRKSLLIAGSRVAVTLLVGLLISCSSGGDSPSNQENETVDTAAFERAVSYTCNRLGLAFTSNDVNFLLDELAQNVAGTGYSFQDAVDALGSQCPAKVNYANALP